MAEGSEGRQNKSDPCFGTAHCWKGQYCDTGPRVSWLILDGMALDYNCPSTLPFQDHSRLSECGDDCQYNGLDGWRIFDSGMYVCSKPHSSHLLTSPLTDGATRICGTLFSEMRNAVFANVAQAAVRKIARDTFDHLLRLDLKFHLERQTGGLTRAIDRGTKYVQKICPKCPFSC